MNHLGACIGLLVVIGKSDGIKLTERVIALEDAGGVFPSNGGTGFDLCPGDFAGVSAAESAFGDEVKDTAVSVFVTGEPILDGRIFYVCVIKSDDFDDGGM